jgi:uncharacterized protein (TIGR03437 family)
LLLGGRQVTSSGAISKAFQSVGTATFDGLSKVTLNLTANTVGGTQSFGTPLVYTGTYSLQSNCEGSIGITSGDSATFALSAYSIDTTTGLARDIYLVGSDATYAYNGSGSVATATCPASALNGAYPFNATGDELSGGTVTGATVLAGLMQFDGQGNVTATWNSATNLGTASASATGTYSLTSTCQGAATLTDTAGNKYTLAMSLDGTAPNFAFLASTPTAIVDGSARKQIATATGTCAAATLTGTYELTLSGRFVTTAGVTTRTLNSNGAVTFDGQSKVTMKLTANSANGAVGIGTALTYSGTYTLQPNCTGTINITTGDTATFTILAFTIDAATGVSGAFQMIGSDANYIYNGGGNVQPAACATATLSGVWPFTATGNLLAGVTDAGAVDVTGLLQFDGQGNFSANWTASTNTANLVVSATGTYSINSACLGTGTITDAGNTKYSVAFSVYGANASGMTVTVATPEVLFTGTAPVLSVNPALAVVNAASNTASATPPGSIFTIYGTNLATKEGEATTVPLPTTLLTTTVTVNGEAAPIFYENTGQINAQMPEDIAPGLATVIVKNGTAVSNAVAVTVPATGTPGIFVYGSNQAVVVNQNGSVNSSAAQAKVGDVLVAYFTGGGPVTGGKVTSGAATAGAYQISGASSVTLDGKAATVNYIGLTPGSIGLYQVNFVVPSGVAAGNRNLVITIAGTASNNPLVSVSN